MEKEGVAQSVKGTEKVITAALVAQCTSQFLKTALRFQIASGSISGATYRSTAARL